MISNHIHYEKLDQLSMSISDKNVGKSWRRAIHHRCLRVVKSVLVAKKRSCLSINDCKSLLFFASRIMQMKDHADRPSDNQHLTMLTDKEECSRKTPTNAGTLFSLYLIVYAYWSVVRL